MAINVVELLEALKEEYITSVDSVLDRIAEGEFDTDVHDENALGKGNVKGISKEDAEFLANL